MSKIKPKLRRTIYIGLGGTGIKTILKVKENFYKSCGGRTPSMIKFVCIDTNLGDLNGKETDPVRLDNAEKLHLSISNPAGSFKSGSKRGKYSWMPEENIDSVADIRGTGAGQVRSNGRFVLEYNEEKDHSISGYLTSIYEEVTNAVAEDSFFDVLDSAKTDVHLIFSVAGGTGSGMFLRMATLIRQNIPNCNIIGYAFSPSFFEGVGVTWNIKHNAYGAMLELDFNMHGNRSEYKSLPMGITDKLFDAVMYIDNKTYTNDQQQQDFTYQFDEVIENVGNALYLSAGQIGADTASIIDNLRTAMNSGGYDHAGKDGMKNGWVASVGVSEIFCKDSADIELKTNQSALNVLNNLLSGDDNGLNMRAINSWIDDFNINESKGDDDGDKLINKILEPAVYKSPVSESIIDIDDWGAITGDSTFRERNQRKINEVWVKKDVIVSQKETEFFNKLKETLFPVSDKTIGLNNLIQIVISLKNDIKSSKEQLTEEINNFENKAVGKEKEKEAHIEIIKAEKRSKFPANASKVASAKGSVRTIIVDLFKINCEIDRRREAIRMYDDFLKIITEYVGDQEGYGFLYQLKQNIQSGINSLNTDTVENFRTPDAQSEAKSTSVDLTSLVNGLPTAKAEDHPIKDWSEFFEKTKYTSVSDLAKKKDWGEFAKKTFKDLYKEQGMPIIYRVLGTLDREDRIQNFKKVIYRARPLTDISSFGEIVKHDRFIFVSVPYDITPEKYEELKDEFLEAFGKRKGKNSKGIEFIQHRDNNKIFVYCQVGVIPPFYLSGMSYTKNDIQNINSCEYEYRKYIESTIHNSYTPFTDIFYKKAYEDEGHSLDGVHRQQIVFGNLELWINSFIFGLIERKGDLYRIQYDKGERDLSTRPIRSWKNLAEKRTDAYEAFAESESKDEGFLIDLSSRIKKLLLDKQNIDIRKQFYGVGDDKANLYLDKSLIDFDSEEFQDIEVQKLIDKELDFLRDNK